MASDALTGVRVVSFEARRAEELATMLARHGAEVVRAPALREAPLPALPEAIALARHLEGGTVAAVILTTGVGTRSLVRGVAHECPRLPELLARTTVVARGPKPLAALRELGVSGAHPVPEPFTFREVLGVIDRLGLPVGALVAVQEYGIPVPALCDGLRVRGLQVLTVPVYRWALPDDSRPLREAAQAIARGEADVALFTNAAQVEHLFRIAEEGEVLRAAFGRMVVGSVGPVTSEALEAHGVAPDLEASPPKMGPLVALVAGRAPSLLAAKRGEV